MHVSCDLHDNHNLSGIFLRLINLNNPVFGDGFDDHLETQPSRFQARFVFVARNESHFEKLIIISKSINPKLENPYPVQSYQSRRTPPATRITLTPSRLGQTPGSFSLRSAGVRRLESVARHGLAATHFGFDFKRPMIKHVILLL